MSVDPQKGNRIPEEGLFRMEKSVMTKSNFDGLSEVSGDNIPEALLEYICYEHQYNIFGYGILDPVEFAGRFHFSLSKILASHPEPYQLQLRKLHGSASRQNYRLRQSGDRVEQENIICRTRLENALFILANYALDITATAVLDDHTLVRQYGFLRVIESFSLIQDGKTGKITYAYKLDDKFRRNLSSMYLTTRLESLVALRKSGLGSLYVFLLKLRDALFAEGRTDTRVDTTPTFDYLCQMAGIPEEKEPKYRKRDLNRAINKIRQETELIFSLEWVRGGGQERYTPIFHFTPRDGQVIGLCNEHYARHLRDMERIDIAVLEFKHNLVDVCPFKGNRYAPDAEDFFYEWVSTDSPEADNLVRYALEKTFVNLGCGIPFDINERVRLFRSYARTRSRVEFSSWIRELFSGLHGFSVPVFKCRDDRH